MTMTSTTKKRLTLLGACFFAFLFIVSPSSPSAPASSAVSVSTSAPAPEAEVPSRLTEDALMVSITHEPPSDLLPLRRIDPNKPMIALTFDDGPSRIHTHTILDTLAEHEVLATFFVVENAVRRNPHVLTRTTALGHEVLNHSATHTRFTELSASQMQAEVTRTSQTLYEVLGYAPPSFFRFPYGAFNHATLSAIGELGYLAIGWSIDPEDWRDRDPDIVYVRVMDELRDGDIILLHDIHPTTAEAVKNIVPSLLAQGFQLVTISELIYYRDLSTEAGTIIHHGR